MTDQDFEKYQLYKDAVSGEVRELRVILEVRLRFYFDLGISRSWNVMSIWNFREVGSWHFMSIKKFAKFRNLCRYGNLPKLEIYFDL